MWETLHTYLETQCSTIADLLPEIGKKADKKDVHKLRVSIKKARACMALAQHITGAAFKGKKYIRLLKVLHQSVGVIRDLQLQQEHLRQYTKKHPQRYRIFHLLLKSHYQLALQQAQAIATAFPVKFIRALPKQLDKKQLTASPAASQKQLSAYFQEQYTAIVLPAGNVPAEKWHDLRKHIKRLHYQLEIVQPQFGNEPTIQHMLQFTDEAGSRMGAWHDLLALRVFVQESAQLMRHHKIPLSAGVTELSQTLTAEIRERLQQCKLWLQQKIEIKID